jgi:CBS domain-containing protein
MPDLREILARRPAVVHKLNANATVRDAVRVMEANGVGAVVIARDEEILGIFSERDLLRRVVAANVGLETPVREVMTPDPLTVSPEDTRAHAIEQMRQLNCRHLPVVSDGELIDTVSIRDLVFDEIRDRDYEIAELNRYIHSSW